MGIRRAGLPILSGLLLGLLAGCYTVVYPNQDLTDSDPVTTTEPYVEPTTLGEYELCAFATDAVHQIILELWSAPDEEALVDQTVATYTKYAKRLRELAAKADTPQRRTMIEAAAVAAEAYAKEVDRRNTYKAVDIDPTIEASKDAFPGCDLDR